MRSKLFFVVLTILLIFPALVLIVDCNFSFTFRGSYLFANYLYLAAPQLLTAAIGLNFKGHRTPILCVLILLNILLFLFKLWICFDVPSRESGLAWILYIPLWISVLVMSAGVLLLLAKRRVRGVTTR